MKKCWRFLALGILAATAAFAAEPPPITGDEGATYDDLIREQALVTIILKQGAPEHNLRIRALYPEASKPTIAVETSSGEKTAHLFANIREVRVQKERIRTDDKPDPETVLTADDKKIVEDATNRTLTLFKETHITPLKMTAASVLAASDHVNKSDALTYLKELSRSNDAATAMAAALLLWANGETVADEVILNGFNSGNRDAKAAAAQLAGLTEGHQFIAEVRRLLTDPSSEVYPHAAVAIGRLGDRESLPKLYDGIRVISEEKSEAAAYALYKIGGPDVVRQLQQMLPNARGMEWFRIVRVLRELGDAEAAKLFETETLGQPPFQRLAALELATEGNLEAVKFLRDFLVKPVDPDPVNLIYRAAVGLTLYEEGDLQAKGIIADVLNTQTSDIYLRGQTSNNQAKNAAVQVVQAGTCAIIGYSMRRDLLPLLASPMQSADEAVTLSACVAIMQIANRDFGKRVNMINIASSDE
jgi:HEAT repeat protein